MAPRIRNAGEASSRARRRDGRTFGRPAYMSRKGLVVGRARVAVLGRQRSKLAKGTKAGDGQREPRGRAGKSRASASVERTPVGCVL